ncbi:MAG: DUF4912 domain-containing protein [Acidobacteria bacterium]|nr:DUF4912 domain-containing protein [Acidobacteriota bacterium]
MSEEKKDLESGEETLEFVLDEPGLPGSGEFVSAAAEEVKEVAVVEESPEPAEPEEIAAEEMSPVFKLLARPSLPRLESENRARLQMQSPNRLHFYWSVRSNPFQTLNKALGAATSNYTLVVRLVDLRRESEELHRIDPEGNWWFSVDADSQYRAEVGFYAPNRPFVRVLYSNTIETPRKSPSRRTAAEAEWRVPAQKFAQVLDVAGFKQDAFDVAIAGDDADAAGDATYRAFGRLSGKPASEFAGLDTEELRYAMLALAAGATLEQLRFRVGERIFAVLERLAASASKGDALKALRSEFDIEEEELHAEEEEFGPAVFGASLVNFPKRTRLRKRPRGFDRVSKFEPMASHSLAAR